MLYKRGLFCNNFYSVKGLASIVYWWFNFWLNCCSLLGLSVGSPYCRGYSVTVGKHLLKLINFCGFLFCFLFTFFFFFLKILCLTESNGGICNRDNISKIILNKNCHEDLDCEFCRINLCRRQAISDATLSLAAV